jgi:GTP-binding protein HflX
MVGIELKERTAWDVDDSLQELAQLATTAGGEVVGQGTQKMDAPVASTYIGPGKAAEFALECKSLNADTVIFDDELTAAQSRNLEKVFECKVLSRTALILDIFAQRARTREGKMQIELAQLEHLLPRLTRYWGHLSRQKGGIGMRGEGETQLETDRRRVQERIQKIQEELLVVQQQRTTQRLGRRRNAWPLASIVGYTNAGKSTLFNALTGAAVLAEDKLFATLDPTTRRLRLETNQNVLLSDTVGFIRKLPHRLVEAFKATLEEVVQADLLVHVVDISHPNAEEQILAVNEVLGEIGAGEKPVVMVFNKMDRFDNREILSRFQEKFPNGVGVSAKTGDGFVELRAELSKALRPIRLLVELEFPHDASAVMARLHALAQVLERDYDGPKTRIKARVPPFLLYEFEPYIVKQDP